MDCDKNLTELKNFKIDLNKTMMFGVSVLITTVLFYILTPFSAVLLLIMILVSMVILFLGKISLDIKSVLENQLNFHQDAKQKKDPIPETAGDHTTTKLDE